MTDELAHIMVLHLDPFRREQRHFDADEHVESAWIPWSDLAGHAHHLIQFDDRHPA